MGNLKLLVRNAREQRDPVCLTGSGTEECQFFFGLFAIARRTRRTAYMPELTIPIEFRVEVSFHNLRLASSRVEEPDPCLKYELVSLLHRASFSELMPYTRRRPCQQLLTAAIRPVPSSTEVSQGESHDRSGNELLR